MDTEELIKSIKDTIKDYDNNRVDCCDCYGCCDCCSWLSKVDDLVEQYEREHNGSKTDTDTIRA